MSLTTSKWGHFKCSYMALLGIEMGISHLPVTFIVGVFTKKAPDF